MKNEKLYQKTVDILVQAYFNDTLEHTKCHACVVGNLCGGKSAWSEVFMTAWGEQTLVKSRYVGEAKKQIDGTGYSLKQLMKIEFAFETADEGDSQDEWMFNGLMAVIDVLDKIHENKNEQLTIQSKNKFIKQIV